jgi:hypothetical protein
MLDHSAFTPHSRHPRTHLPTAQARRTGSGGSGLRCGSWPAKVAQSVVSPKKTILLQPSGQVSLRVTKKYVRRLRLRTVQHTTAATTQPRRDSWAGCDRMAPHVYLSAHLPGSGILVVYCAWAVNQSETDVQQPASTRKAVASVLHARTTPPPVSRHAAFGEIRKSVSDSRIST